MSSSYPYAMFFLASFFCNVPATTEIYTLSLHDALPISSSSPAVVTASHTAATAASGPPAGPRLTRNRAAAGWWANRSDRKSTRLNSSHEWISYAVFCLKKKKTNMIEHLKTEHLMRKQQT